MQGSPVPFQACVHTGRCSPTCMLTERIHEGCRALVCSDVQQACILTPSTCCHSIRLAPATCLQVRAFPDDDSLRHFRDWVNLPPAALMGPDGQAVEGEASAILRAVPAASILAAPLVRCMLPGSWLTLISHARAHDSCCTASIGGGSPRAAACFVQRFQWQVCGAEGAEDTEVMQRFKKGHKNARKSWTLPDTFPNHVVIAEYMSPLVDTARDRRVQPAATQVSLNICMGAAAHVHPLSIELV